MLQDYLIVHKSILPKCYETILETKHLIDSNSAITISQAIQMTGVSRSTFYKYKDYILEPSDLTGGRHAVISFVLSHETGILNSVLNCISKAGANILTINQSLPIRSKANVTVSLDISSMQVEIADLLVTIKQTAGTENVKLVAVE